MTFRDQSFCLLSRECLRRDCPRKLTDDLRAEALRWGKEAGGAWIAYADFRGSDACPGFVGVSDRVAGVQP